MMVLKRLTDAISDGNTIRAVIRSIRSNEDGKTPGITQPSKEAQEALIKETYDKAALSRTPTRLFEAHGTGTTIGDPREAKAIGSAFRKHRSDREPLYMYVTLFALDNSKLSNDKWSLSGAVKSNIGHLEGASGIAGVLKVVLALERGIIPPNTNFEKINPRIDAEFLRLNVGVAYTPCQKFHTYTEPIKLNNLCSFHKKPSPGQTLGSGELRSILSVLAVLTPTL